MLLATHIEGGVFPGAQLLAARNSQVVLDIAAGTDRTGGASAAVSSNSIYDISSLSNLVGTTSAVMLASESHSLVATACVQDYIPEFKGTDIENLRIQSLLQAFSNSSRLSTETRNAREEALKEIASRTTGMLLDDLLTTQLYDPLGLKQTSFNPLNGFGKEIGGPAEATSMFSNARDLGVFSQMLLNRGVYDHQRYFKTDTIGTFTGSWGPWSRSKAFGWTARLFSPSAFGHFATTGSFIWIDPAKDLFVVFLTNSSEENEELSQAQRQILESIMSEI